MDFPATYLAHDKVNIDWSYAWGRVEDDIFFHCAHFNVIKDGELTSATHVSYHDPAPHYYEVVSNGFGMFLNAIAYDVNAIRVYIKDKGKYIKHRGHVRKHRYSPSCYVNLITDDKDYHGIGWCGEETSKKHWAGIIYEENDVPIVDNWEWLGIKLDDGRSVMVYNTKRKNYCCVIDNDKVMKSKKFWYQANYLHVPECDLKMTIVPIAMKRVFSPQVGMKYSEQPFKVLSNKGGGYGMREQTFGGIEVDKEYLWEGNDGIRS